MSPRGRSVALALAAGTLLAVAPLAGNPASAAPAAAPPVAAAPEDSSDVTATVEALEPRDVQPGSSIVVTAVLRNATGEPTGPLSVRLRRGFVLDTRGELQAADNIPPVTEAGSGQPLPLEDGLAAGRSARITYRTSVAELAMGALGVYPLALTVQSGTDGTELGRARALLPFFPSGIDVSATRIALLWPLLDRPHRLTGDGDQRAPAVFLDDALAASVRRGGRLDGLLAAAERAPRSVRLTLLIDPETIDELDRMTRGYRIPSGPRLVPGTGGPAAAAWLSRLRRLAPKHLLVAVPYADPDLVALERGGEPAPARVEQPDIDAVTRVLAVEPNTKLSWPPDGLLTDTVLDEVVAQGAGAVVVDPSALPGGPAADSGRTPSGASPLPALGGQAVALVADPVVQRLLTSGGRQRGGLPGGPRIAEQRLLAELGMITAEAPSSSRMLVLAPPRRWDPPAGYAAALVADLGRLPWLASTDALQAAATTAPVDRGALVYPAGAQRLEIRAPQVQQLGTVRGLVADFRGTLSNADANALLSPFGDALRRAGSSAWRGDPAGGGAYVTRLRRQIGALRGQVSISPPATGDYTLASTDSQLPLTLENRLDAPVNVRVRLDTPPGFSTRDAGVIQIPARGKRSVRISTLVQRTGTFAVTGRLTSPDGGDLGRAVTLSVRSTAYGGLALGITGLAFAVLVGAVLVRLIRRLRARSEAAPTGAGSPADRSRS